jgi:hypothetical protein
VVVGWSWAVFVQVTDGDGELGSDGEGDASGTVVGNGGEVAGSSVDVGEELLVASRVCEGVGVGWTVGDVVGDDFTVATAEGEGGGVGEAGAVGVGVGVGASVGGAGGSAVAGAVVVEQICSKGMTGGFAPPPPKEPSPQAQPSTSEC